MSETPSDRNLSADARRQDSLQRRIWDLRLELEENRFRYLPQPDDPGKDHPDPDYGDVDAATTTDGIC